MDVGRSRSMMSMTKTHPVPALVSLASQSFPPRQPQGGKEGTGWQTSAAPLLLVLLASSPSPPQRRAKLQKEGGSHFRLLPDCRGGCANDGGGRSVPMGEMQFVPPSRILKRQPTKLLLLAISRTRQPNVAAPPPPLALAMLLGRSHVENELLPSHTRPRRLELRRAGCSVGCRNRSIDRRDGSEESDRWSAGSHLWNCECNSFAVHWRHVPTTDFQVPTTWTVDGANLRIEKFRCRSSSPWPNKQIMTLKKLSEVKEQGTDLIDLRLTWREMENLILGRFLKIFVDLLEEIWRVFEEFWRN